MTEELSDPDIYSNFKDTLRCAGIAWPNQTFAYYELTWFKGS